MSKHEITRREMLKLTGTTGLAAFLAACAPEALEQIAEVQEEAAAQPEAAGECTPVAWWNSKGGLELTAPMFQKLVDDFNAANPDICVEQSPYGGSWEEAFVKLTTAFSAGIGPDVCNPGGIVITLGEAGHVMDHREWLQDKGLQDAYTDTALAAMSRKYTAGEPLYGVPQWVACFPLCFFRHHYEEAGLPVDKPPQDLDQILEYAEKLTVREGNKVVRAGFLNQTGGASYAYGLFNLIRGHGGTIFDKDNPYEVMLGSSEVAAALQWYGDTDQKWHVGWEKGFSGQALGNPWNQELCSMWYGHNSKLPRLPEPLQPFLEVGSVPKAPIHQVIYLAVEGQSVNPNSKHLEATLRFYETLQSKEFVGAYDELYAKEPPRKDLSDLPHLQDARHQKWLEFGAAYGDPGDGWHPKWAEVRDILIQAVDRVVINYEDAQTVLNDAQKEAQAVVDDWKAAGGTV